MKIKVFFAADGDCLLLTSADGHHVLVDGGRTRSFEQHTRPLLQDLVDSGDAIDLVVVSHIDADHISGVISLLKDVSAWAVYDYQIGEGRNPTFPQPARPRPPEIKGLWHNSWRAQLRDLAGPITAFAGRVSAAMELVPTAATNLPASAQGVLASVTDLAESIADGVNLLKLVEDETPIPHNAGFGKLVLLRDPMHVESVGATTLKVIGPMEQHLRRLRADWQTWLEHQLGAVQPQPGSGVGAGISGRHLTGGELTTAFGLSIDEAESVLASIAAATEILEKTDAARVTPPNRASITLLAEENGKTCLLTGDAAEDELLAGLAAAGCFPDGAAFRCDVLKVQHHGSEYNLSRAFASKVLAEHYVLCADGAHGNPNPSVIKTIIDTRLAADPRPFTIWFNCSENRTIAGRRIALGAAIREAREAQALHPDVISVEVLADDRSFFEIEL